MTEDQIKKLTIRSIKIRKLRKWINNFINSLLLFSGFFSIGLMFYLHNPNYGDFALLCFLVFAINYLMKSEKLNEY